MNLFRKVVVPLVLVVLVVATVLTLTQSKDQKTLTALFPRTVSIYEGSDVRVLGVPVGNVDTVVPDGTDVKVTMTYDASVKVPDDAKAVIVAPSIVGDRYIQLTPAYDGGQVLASGTTLGEDRTAVPLELDQIYGSIDDLTVALGPKGANKNGALNDLVKVTAKNFAGQGENFHQTIQSFGRLSATLDDNKDALFDSQARLEGFIGTLAKNDGTVRRFSDSLASVSTELAGERRNLAGALQNLSVALTQVSTFVRDNKDILGRNITDLNRVAKVLVKRRAQLDETLKVAPLALNNLALTYNPQNGTLDTSSNTGELINQITSDPATYLCGLVSSNDANGQICDLIRQALPRPGALAAFRGKQGSTSSSVPLTDPTLGGLVQGGQ